MRHRRVITAAVVVVVAALAVTGWSEHWPPSWLFGAADHPAPVLTWTAAQAPLPAGATRGGSQSAALNDVACPSAGSCVAVGYYATGSSGSNISGLIETLSNGHWTPATAPPRVAASGQGTLVSLTSIACPAVGDCVAVGVTGNSAGLDTPLAETLRSNVWTAAAPAVPGDAKAASSAVLTAIACPAAGSCVATGWYTDHSGDSALMIDTLSNGVWTARRAPLPAGAVPQAPSTSTLPTDLASVRCTAVGSCVATGDYADRHTDSLGVIDTLSGGTWTAQRAPLPGDAAAPNPEAFLVALACQAPGSCVAAGHYNSRGGQSRDLVATLSDGTWVPAATPLPADAAAHQKWDINEVTGLSAVACQTAGSCSAWGSYLTRDGALGGVIASLSGGTWTAAAAPLPAGAAAGAKGFAYFDSAACPAPGTCFVVGGYRRADDSTQVLIEAGA